MTSANDEVSEVVAGGGRNSQSRTIVAAGLNLRFSEAAMGRYVSDEPSLDFNIIKFKLLQI